MPEDEERMAYLIDADGDTFPLLLDEHTMDALMELLSVLKDCRFEAAEVFTKDTPNRKAVSFYIETGLRGSIH